jgi:hypothetical protein
MPEHVNFSSDFTWGVVGCRDDARVMVTYSSVLRLRNPEKDDNGLDAAPYGEDNICSPANFVH